jgi:hypothetical protein
VDELRGLTALRKADRAQAARDQLGQEAGALAERACPKLERLVEHGRVPEGDCARRARGAVVRDNRRVDAEQGARELARVGDRR